MGGRRSQHTKRRSLTRLLSAMTAGSTISGRALMPGSTRSFRARAARTGEVAGEEQRGRAGRSGACMPCVYAPVPPADCASVAVAGRVWAQGGTLWRDGRGLVGVALSGFGCNAWGRIAVRRWEARARGTRGGYRGRIWDSVPALDRCFYVAVCIGSRPVAAVAAGMHAVVADRDSQDACRLAWYDGSCHGATLRYALGAI